MSKATEAAKLIRQIAADNSHGYAWGGNGPGDFDCSGLVNYVWQSVGVPVNKEVRNTTRTMKTYYCRHGFSDVTKSVNLKTGAGLEIGDVPVNTANHTAMYVGGGKIVQARSNLDGKAGDSSGQEIREQAYYNYPWDTVLRYTAESSQAQSAAEGAKPTQSTEISVTVGNETAAAKPVSAPAQSVALNCAVKLPTLKMGAKSGYVTAFQEMLLARGYSVAGPVKNGQEQTDGQFGPTMRKNVIAWQKKAGLTADGIIGEKSWSAMLAGK